MLKEDLCPRTSHMHHHRVSSQKGYHPPARKNTQPREKQDNPQAQPQPKPHYGPISICAVILMWIGITSTQTHTYTQLHTRTHGYMHITTHHLEGLKLPKGENTANPQQHTQPTPKVWWHLSNSPHMCRDTDVNRGARDILNEAVDGQLTFFLTPPHESKGSAARFHSHSQARRCPTIMELIFSVHWSRYCVILRIHIFFFAIFPGFFFLYPPPLACMSALVSSRAEGVNSNKVQQSSFSRIPSTLPPPPMPNPPHLPPSHPRGNHIFPNNYFIVSCCLLCPILSACVCPPPPMSRGYFFVTQVRQEVRSHLQFSISM